MHQNTGCTVLLCNRKCNSGNCDVAFLHASVLFLLNGSLTVIISRSRLFRSLVMGNLFSGLLGIIFFIISSNHRLRSHASSDFPHNLDGWDHNSIATPVTKLGVRIWNTSDLESAFSVLNLGQMHSFFERLAAGNPVTVLAIGDSIVKDFGGCFHQNE